jgi:hypothetical protein
VRVAKKAYKRYNKYKNKQKFSVLPIARDKEYGYMLQESHLKVSSKELAQTFQAEATPSEENSASHILIIDDSHRICSVLATAIVNNCVESRRSCQIVQYGRFGGIETVPMNFSNETRNENAVTLYLADSTKHALPALRLPGIKRMTIICDVIMPADTEVGLFGFLSELVTLQLPVNLLFASSEGQCRYYVEQLIQNHKAYFVEKGTAAWIDLPYALVHRSQMFHYRVLTRPDFDKGRLQASNSAARLNPEYLEALEAAASAAFASAHSSAKVERPSSSNKTVSTSSAASTNVLADDEFARPLRSFTRPLLKVTTGLLSRLAFWRHDREGTSQPPQ